MDSIYEQLDWSHTLEPKDGEVLASGNFRRGSTQADTILFADIKKPSNTGLLEGFDLNWKNPMKPSVNPSAKPILSSTVKFKRLLLSDLDRNGLEDLIVLEYGRGIYALSVFRCYADRKFLDRQIVHFKSPGDVKITLADIDADGDKEVCIFLVEPNEILIFRNFVNEPEASFKFEGVAGNCGNSFQFYNTSIADFERSSFHWDFGDGTKSNEPSPFHEYVEGGSMKLELIVSRDEKSDTLRRGLSVILPDVEVPLIAIKDQQVLFQDYTQEVNGWSWVFDDGAAFSASGFGRDFAVVGPQQFDLYLTNVSQSDCTVMYSQEIIVYKKKPKNLRTDLIEVSKNSMNELEVFAPLSTDGDFIQIYNSACQIFRSESLNDNRALFSMESWPKGKYFAALISKDGTTALLKANRKFKN